MSTTEKAFKFSFFQLPITVQSQKHLLKLLKSTDKNNSYQFIGLDVRVAHSILIRSLQRSPAPVTSSHRHWNLQDLLFLHHLLLSSWSQLSFRSGPQGTTSVQGISGSPGSVGSGYGLWGMCLWDWGFAEYESGFCVNFWKFGGRDFEMVRKREWWEGCHGWWPLMGRGLTVGRV